MFSKRVHHLTASLLLALACDAVMAQTPISYSYDAAGNRTERAPQTEVAVAPVESSVDDVEPSYEMATASNSFTQEEKAPAFRDERFLRYAWAPSQETTSWDECVRPMKNVPLDCLN
jgi:hypothetical protein